MPCHWAQLPLNSDSHVSSGIISGSSSQSLSTPAWEEKGSEVLLVALHAASTLQALTRVPERSNLLPLIPICWIWTWCWDPTGCCLRTLIAVQENQPGLFAAIASQCFQPIVSGMKRWSISVQERTVTLTPIHLSVRDLLKTIISLMKESPAWDWVWEWPNLLLYLHFVLFPV